MARFIKHERKLEAWRDQHEIQPEDGGRSHFELGKQHYTIDGVEVSRDEFYEALGAPRDAQ